MSRHPPAINPAFGLRPAAPRLRLHRPLCRGERREHVDEVKMGRWHEDASLFMDVYVAQRKSELAANG